MNDTSIIIQQSLAERTQYKSHGLETHNHQLTPATIYLSAYRGNNTQL